MGKVVAGNELRHQRWFFTCTRRMRQKNTAHALIEHSLATVWVRKHSLGCSRCQCLLRMEAVGPYSLPHLNDSSAAGALFEQPKFFVVVPDQFAFVASPERGE